ncbi:MSCRAMM family adhesin [Leptothoe spongobia]|uniref:Uncharacterized protein n=1 Tax=Leptothoe spongobia TAU-MAC 1115 TaxID=1967444 RepID=A0A947DHM4_9CYAN|nr:hypothetical protein [Leptothoe spongobia]MBT9317101.1 hypothetical protein [Leptothoe spongobia TAU-MAC 1115]
MTLASVLGHLQQYLAKLTQLLVLIAILLFIASCGGSPQTDNSSSATSEPSNPSLFTPRPKLKQVEPPALIKEFEPWLETYAPQVQIHQPRADQVLDTTTVKVVLRVQDLPIYKDETWGMGPHVEVLLDNQPFGSIYDIDQPLILEHLSPGTHTLRVFAARPWYESFKNEGAYDQVTFHIFAKTDENSPTVNEPLLTYGAPIGTYGAEPVLLDFYLTDAPLHQVAQDNPAISDWQVRYTLNGDSLTLKDWQPIYIEGLKPGQNWLQLALIDDEGKPIPGVFNNTVRLIEYDPALDDTLTKIVRGELTLEEVGRIIDPTYEPPVIEPPVIEPSGTETPMPPEINEGEKLETDLETNVTPIGVPESDVPESDVPEPEAPEPEAPESEAPESDVTEPQSLQIELSNTARESLEKDLKDDDYATENILPTEQPPTLDTDSSATEHSEAKNVEAPNSLDDMATQEIPIEESVENSAPTVDEEKSEAIDPAKSFENNSDLPTHTTATPQSEPTSQATDDHANTVTTESASESTSESTLDNTDGTSESTSDEEIASPKRRYLQRLYDYREKSMKTYSR